MKTLLIALLILASAHFGDAQTPADEPYRISEPADRITCFSPGIETSPITTCVVETGAGLVVIDTGLSPSMAARTRARIATEIGQDEFRWVINTHSHFDHSGGNQVFDDALIIGHENAGAAIQSFYAGREAWIERRKGWLARQQESAEYAETGSNAATALAERLRFNRELIGDLRSSFQATPPSLTFSDRLTVHVGNLEIRLIFFGRAHTDSDIVIHAPSLGVLFTGDLFHERVLGVAAGSTHFDVDRWLETLDLVLDGDPQIVTVLGGHGLVFTPQWMLAQRRYLKEVWLAVCDARCAGQTLDELIEQLPFDDRFAFIADRFDPSVTDLEEQHERVLGQLWNETAGSR